ncbi:YihY/virulence factor BrkB family protein [Listeria booriae]|uniref:Ribonuclease n=1 Tax=Listeria booriae TaxID=1552123 RepID=A0A099WF35_9LIST|nr:YihY/virulence factor BrkB family protein [Listeria booriae]KGL44344.1 ribonuclease [Listeria booriae]MBC1228394.1 YihY/virulence factor BrkB family protein [Listeria booriae]MBC1402704.1 YihY/virulence factor BrkB family protein [Listeria booriae]MBC1524479.1 YihY/virulence factor BrkB family protein [Listeria booriae]MBC1531267.1 YihY/virulence factor BrkB family protein [Listeria booriae]
MFKKLQNNHLVRFGMIISKRFTANDVSGSAAQLAYYMLFSIFPMLLIVASLLPYFNIDQDQLFTTIKQFVPEEIYDFINTNLDQLLNSHTGGLLSIGILATLWSASNGMNATTKALNKAYSVLDRRNYLVKRLLSVLFTIGMLAVITVTLLLLVFGQQIGMFIFNHLHVSQDTLDIWNNFRWVVTLAVIFIVFTFIFWIAPNRRSRLFSILPGSVFATIGWAAASFGFAYYVNNFANYSATYGSIGVIIILMLWFYLTGIILMIGGEINAALSILKQKKLVGEIN